MESNNKNKGKNSKTSNSKRNIEKDNEKYYTNSKFIDISIDIINKANIIKKNDMIIEPSAGNGAFINGIKTLSNKNHFYDIQPESPAITKQDFLELDLSNTYDEEDDCHFIGNPPFGRQSSLAIKFIKKICLFDKTKSVSFILPKSFKKLTLQRSFPLKFHLEEEVNVPKNSFILNGKDIDIPCVFQIWVKKEIEREIPIKQEPSGYSIEKKVNIDFDKDKYVLSFRRVGISAGSIDHENLQDKSFQSHHFLKLNEKTIYQKLIKSKEKIIKEFTHDNTVGPRSLSKQDIIIVLNKYTLN